MKKALTSLYSVVLSCVVMNCIVLSGQAYAAGRDTITAVGSSTVYPFSTVAAEQFGKKNRDYRTPKIESTGTGGGMKLFCVGNGINTPDMANASRRMKKSEFDMCQANGVTSITELLVGFDGIVMANTIDAPQVKLTRKEIFLALAKEVPSLDGSGELIPNPYIYWSDINPALSKDKIVVLGPPPTSGTRDAFVELVMEGGCKQFPSIAAIKKTNKNRFKAICHSIRENDQAYVTLGENDNLIVQKLVANPKALGIFGYSFLEQNEDKLHGAYIDGKEPTYDSIAKGDYAVSRPLYVYIKNSHVNRIPGFMAFLREYTSDSAMGEEGYLTDKGLIPLGDEKRRAVRESVLSLKPLQL
jgi:phosphate transport system substrate-binding protein